MAATTFHHGYEFIEENGIWVIQTTDMNVANANMHYSISSIVHPNPDVWTTGSVSSQVTWDFTPDESWWQIEGHNEPWTGSPVPWWRAEEQEDLPDF